MNISHNNKIAGASTLSCEASRPGLEPINTAKVGKSSHFWWWLSRRVSQDRKFKTLRYRYPGTLTATSLERQGKLLCGVTGNSTWRTLFAGSLSAMDLTTLLVLGQVHDAILECSKDTTGQLSPCCHTAICISNAPSRGVGSPLAELSRGQRPCSAPTPNHHSFKQSALNRENKTGSETQRARWRRREVHSGTRRWKESKRGRH